MIKIVKEDVNELSGSELFKEIARLASDIANGKGSDGTNKELINLFEKGKFELNKDNLISARIIKGTNGFKEFEKNDWYGYAGCSKFIDGSEPLIKSTDLQDECGVDIIVSAFDYDESTMSISVYTYYEDGETGYFTSDNYETDDVNKIIEITNKVDKAVGSSENNEELIENLENLGFHYKNG